MQGTRAFRRDPSCWIFGETTMNPGDEPAGMPETMITGPIDRSPDVRRREVPVLLGGPDGNWGRRRVGGVASPLGLFSEVPPEAISI